jgi:heme/copper-type cytochrome/quinol oxidase subunit 2
VCGAHHAYMQTAIQVVTEEEYQAWLREMGARRMA